MPDLIATISDLMAEGACSGVPHMFNRERIVTTMCPHLPEAQEAELRSKCRALDGADSPTWVARRFCRFGRISESRLAPLGGGGPKQ